MARVLMTRRDRSYPAQDQRSEYQPAHLGDHQTLRAACAPRIPMSQGEMDRATQYHQ